MSHATKYRTIVADPPWHYGKSGRLHSFKIREDAGPMPYPTMAVDEIAALPVSHLAQDSSHLYLWTTQRYLSDAQEIAAHWGFRYSKILTWCKSPTGFVMGDVFGNTTEFVVFATRGGVRPLARIPRDWWEWPRSGHSAKPEAFLDLVEQVSPGPYLEMFARRQRLGWDTWGNEALNHVALAPGGDPGMTWQDFDLAEDSDRLVAIAERVLAGEPIESFDLGEYEIFVVRGYCERAAGLVGGDPE